ncbi:hypothetical protein GCM10009106_21570 [Sphingomonas japonica]
MTLIAVVLLALVARHPSADIRILAHDAGDPSPRRVQAAMDMGIAAVSVLVTWTARRALD